MGYFWVIKMDNPTAEEILNRVKIADVLERYHIPLGRGGRTACPIHHGKKPNFSYNDEVFQCWSCGAKGNVISLVMQLHGLNFGQAMIRMNADFDLRLPIARRLSHRERAALNKKAVERKKARKREEAIRGLKRMIYDLAVDAYRMLWREDFEPAQAEAYDRLEDWLDDHIDWIR